MLSSYLLIITIYNYNYTVMSLINIEQVIWLPKK